MAHAPLSDLRGDNAEDHIYAKLHIEHAVSCVLKCLES